MSTKSSIEIGYRQGGSDSTAEQSFHLLLPVSDRDCAQCLAVAEQGMQEISKLVGALEARAAREALLNAVGDAVRSMVGTRTIKMIAAGSLGDFLKVDRCFFVEYDRHGANAVIEFDWCRDGLKSIAGTYEFGNRLSQSMGFRSGKTSVACDAGASSLTYGRLQPAASIHVPLLEHGFPVGAVVVAMDREARHWKPEDVCLVENIASIARSAIDTDHLRSRERNLRASYRSALVPGLPHSIKCIDLSVVYRPADTNAGVGGDFYDIFELVDGRVALILGDVGGRGLQAASQVAAVRYMLRFALCQRRPLAEAVDEVNEIVIRHRLLQSYASVFVSIFDPAARTLTYVCCGQEPPLLRSRVTDHISVLAPTGPVLGITGHEGYREETLHIDRGDCLLVYTDGLNGMGSGYPSDETERLIQIVGHGRPPFVAANVVDAVMSGIVDHGVRGSRSDTHGAGHDQPCRSEARDFADDVCVFAAVFTP